MDVAADLRRWGIPFEGEPGLEPLAGDAGARRYVRVRTGPGRSVMLMLVPPEGDSPHSAGAAELPYLNVQRFLKARGLPVPEVYGWDPETRRLYHDDFGDARLSSVPDAYESAVDLLGELQRRTAEPDPSCLAFARAFDEAAVRRELSELTEYGIPRSSPGLDAELDALAQEVAALPRRFSHRDFHGDNLLLRPGGTLGILDFQDAFLAPRAYDLASLLTDRQAPDRLGFERIDALVRRSGIPEGEFWLVALQRQLKLAGRFVNLERQGKRGYLRHLPTTWRTVAHALRRGRGPDLRNRLVDLGCPV